MIIPIPTLQLFLSWSVFITKFVLESSSRSDEEERSGKTSSSRNLIKDHGKCRHGAISHPFLEQLFYIG